MVDFANAKFLQPLDARIDSTPDYDASDFFSPLTDITTVDGVRYGVPFYNYALGYLYNTDDLAQAKLAGAHDPRRVGQHVQGAQDRRPGRHRDAAAARLQDLRGVGQLALRRGRLHLRRPTASRA